MKEMEAKTENRYEYRKPQEKRKQMIAGYERLRVCLYGKNMFMKCIKKEVLPKRHRICTSVSRL